MVPPLLRLWADLAGDGRGSWDLSTLRLVQAGGAKCDATLARRVRPELGAAVQQVFGMAEGLLNYTRLDDPDDLVAVSQGRPLSPADEVRVVDREGTDVAEGTAGSCGPAARTRCGATTGPVSTTRRRSPRTATTAPATWCAACRPGTSSSRAGSRTS